MWHTSLATLGLVLAPALQVPQTGAGDTEGVSGAGATAEAKAYSGRARQLDVRVVREVNPEIHIDGRLDEPAWSRAAMLADFTQYEPVEGLPATESTEVLVFYTSDAIYFGVRALDREPQLILARLAERDRSVFADDWIRIMLDTFNDQRQAYVFYVNPLGIQTDGLWIEGMERRGGPGGVSIDFNPDFIWESDGRMNGEGWVAEIKIPYTSLRFRRAPSQDWGIQVAREVKRRGFKQSWAPLTQNVTSTLAQSGRLVGLRDLQPRRLVEINPVATGKRVGQTVDDVYEQDAFQPDFGVNGRVGITQNLIFDGTVNPDFSQVETDANQITVNERFALFFPEKRPFFLEGTEIFRTPRNLVHTRQIADPVGGAKLTGKVGSFNIGYLGAVDESPKTLLGEQHSAAFNLLRVRRDVGRSSTVGVLYTDRSVLGTGRFNRVLSGDARLLFLGRYTLTAQLAKSWTATGSTDVTRSAPLLAASLERSGRTWQLEAKFDDVHPDFSTESGFIPRVGDTELLGRARVAGFGPPGALLEQFGLQVRGDVFYDHQEFWRGGSPFEAEIELQPSLSFRGDRTLTFILRDGYFRFRPEAYDDHETVAPGGQAQPFPVPDALRHLKAFGVMPRLRVTDEIQVNGRMFYREVPIFVEAARGLELQVAPDVTLRPTTASQVTLGYTYSRLWRRRDDSIFSTVHIPRVRAQYQFSKAFAVRAVVQYSLEEQAALRDPTTERTVLIAGAVQDVMESGRFEAQFLAKYEPSPGTVFFIGYSRIMLGSATLRLAQMDLAGEGLFVKASYLFRW